MHESMVAQSLLTAISAEAAEQKAKPIAAKISYGQLYALNEEALRFAFEAIAKGSVCEGVKIEAEQKPLQARCKDCNEIFVPDICSMVCVNCGSRGLDILPDAPLVLEEIEFEGS